MPSHSTGAMRVLEGLRAKIEELAPTQIAGTGGQSRSGCTGVHGARWQDGGKHGPKRQGQRRRSRHNTPAAGPGVPNRHAHRSVPKGPGPIIWQTWSPYFSLCVPCECEPALHWHRSHTFKLPAINLCRAHPEIMQQTVLKARWPGCTVHARDAQHAPAHDSAQRGDQEM